MNNNLKPDPYNVTGQIKLIEKENYENDNCVDFIDKNSTTYWALKLQVTKAQLHRAAKKINSNAVADIAAYIKSKFSLG